MEFVEATIAPNRGWCRRLGRFNSVAQSIFEARRWASPGSSLLVAGEDSGRSTPPKHISALGLQAHAAVVAQHLAWWAFVLSILVGASRASGCAQGPGR